MLRRDKRCGLRKETRRERLKLELEIGCYEYWIGEVEFEGRRKMRAIVLLKVLALALFMVHDWIFHNRKRLKSDGRYGEEESH